MTDLLIACNGIYSKLEQGSRGNGVSAGWFGRRRHDRKKDQLLRYLQHARNAAEHGIEPINTREPGSVALGTGGGAYEFNGRIGPNSINMHIKHLGGPPPQFQITRPHVKLVPVSNDRYGDWFDPPTMHLGDPIEDPSVIGIARLGLNYLAGMIADAAELAE